MKLGAILSVMGPTMESPRGLADQARMLVDEGYEILRQFLNGLLQAVGDFARTGRMMS